MFGERNMKVRISVIRTEDKQIALVVSCPVCEETIEYDSVPMEIDSDELRCPICAQRDQADDA